MEENEKRTENARERTVYIEDRPVWEIGNAEVEPEETGTQTGPLSSVAESAKAELEAHGYNPEYLGDIWDLVITGFWKAARRFANSALLAIETDPKAKHYFKNCKKLRVRKKYKNRMKRNLYQRLEAVAAQEEADE